jgi:hypothetical protein
MNERFKERKVKNFELGMDKLRIIKRTRHEEKQKITITLKVRY